MSLTSFSICCAKGVQSAFIKKVRPLKFSGLTFFKAVRGGFEPPVQFPVRQFSKLLVSATHPPHRLDVSEYAFFKAMQKYKKDAQEQNKN
jgi:hypothetical protein